MASKVIDLKTRNATMIKSRIFSSGICFKFVISCWTKAWLLEESRINIKMSTDKEYKMLYSLITYILKMLLTVVDLAYSFHFILFPLQLYISVSIYLYIYTHIYI